MESLQSVDNEEITLNQDELKAHDKITLRREARRRKILENAKNRLERLNGRTGSTNVENVTTNEAIPERYGHMHWLEPSDYDSAKFSDPEVEPDVAPHQLEANEPPVDFGDLFSALNTEASSTQQQKRHFILRARLHLIISALLSCIFNLIFTESITSSFSIFIPAGLCVVVDLLFFREQQPLNPIINMLITLCNIRLPSQTKNILHLISIIQSLIVDLGVFIFSFCIFSYGLTYINNDFNLLITIK